MKIDLDRPPDRRWDGLAGERVGAQELIEQYVRDLGLDEARRRLVLDSEAEFLDPEYREELTGLARTLEMPRDDVVVANLYYDTLKTALGCTAFAINSPIGPLHARNLDWWTEDSALSRLTRVYEFYARQSHRYTIVGWPGMLGCLSGFAPGRFAVTLNAVLSEESVAVGSPVVFVLRRVLETATCFDEALEKLSSQAIVSDCLLLLSGVKEDEMVVIERTPSRCALRRGSCGVVTVANNYLKLQDGGAPGMLAATSCARYEAALELAREQVPENFEACLRILEDPRVRMEITVQSMVFQAASGRYLLKSVEKEPRDHRSRH